MGKYLVEIPIAGYIQKEIEAESKEDALNKAFEKGYEDEEIIELDMYEKINEGNVCYLYHTKAYAEELEDDEEIED